MQVGSVSVFVAAVGDWEREGGPVAGLAWGWQQPLVVAGTATLLDKGAEVHLAKMRFISVPMLCTDEPGHAWNAMRTNGREHRHQAIRERTLAVQGDELPVLEDGRTGRAGQSVGQIVEL